MKQDENGQNYKKESTRVVGKKWEIPDAFYVHPFKNSSDRECLKIQARPGMRLSG